ncbi:3-methyl-2-oxobutanoate hydroxymethyltransferase [candidate division WOR-1 bacterium RIFCSPHIGHO2_01_FULL_53_15]|uniref:3-methyl-2-oxobutanoate hydroxymethyltransferase n=1 Tax=candidate division WOR-1 bacterium RIFCSPHIGHO2_01_FULL_53_15 TaxID=1802564 RepID=A0A1F4Q2Z4_UNCSA|nr:MAG: 3-methyl-2-oxobutanoate hydroxymethyltransferase [candidate division WOR-1 bacterium RIFCSPHIGHO2_01_FULL_53_15]
MTVNKVRSVKVRSSELGNRKIVMLTAYDFPFARILDEAGVDIVLVGDSLGNVALGYKNTLPVTMEEMIVHTRAVARGVKRALIVADMPFGSYQESDEKAVANAIKLVKAGAEAVKIEGAGYISAIKKIIKAGIPVMGHVGFTPQSVNLLGYRMQGRGMGDGVRILREAKLLEKSGCFAVVLELLPEQLSLKITKALKIPTIGIGAGKKVDGQVLVTNDLLGLYENPPSFVKAKANLRQVALQAIKSFISE